MSTARITFYSYRNGEGSNGWGEGHVDSTRRKFSPSDGAFGFHIVDLTHGPLETSSAFFEKEFALIWNSGRIEIAPGET